MHWTVTLFGFGIEKRYGLAANVDPSRQVVKAPQGTGRRFARLGMAAAGKEVGLIGTALR